MINTKLLTLLEVLNHKELKLLKKWVQSPFFNQRTDVIQLLNLFLKYRKKAQAIPSKSDIFNHLFPNEPYDDHRIRMVMSFLYKLTERFSIYQQQQIELVPNKLTLLKIYRTRKLNKPFQKTAKEIEKLLEQIPYKNANYFRLKFRFHQEQLEYDISMKRFELKNNFQKRFFDSILMIKKQKSNCFKN